MGDRDTGARAIPWHPRVCAARKLGQSCSQARYLEMWAPQQIPHGGTIFCFTEIYAFKKRNYSARKRASCLVCCFIIPQWPQMGARRGSSVFSPGVTVLLPVFRRGSSNGTALLFPHSCIYPSTHPFTKFDYVYKHNIRHCKYDSRPKAEGHLHHALGGSAGETLLSPGGGQCCHGR